LNRAFTELEVEVEVEVEEIRVLRQQSFAGGNRRLGQDRN